jgi:hypothetical protein
VTGSSRARTSDHWWQHPFRMVQTNLRLIDADMDADQVADFVARHGADAWLVNTGGIYASHPSRLASQTANPELTTRPGGDLVSDAVTAAHARGLRYLARMDFSKVLPEHAAAHPDWLYSGPGGERQVFNGLSTTCPSAGYFQDEIFRILDEVLGTYDVDGFFFNWFMYSEYDYAYRYYGPCHCDACHRRFEGDTGLTLPTYRDDAAYPRWQEWSRSMILDLGRRLRAHIHARKPGTPLILHDTADLRYVEANNAVGRAPWHHQTSESVSAALTYLPDAPVLVNCVSFLDFPYRMGAEEPERFAQYLIQAIARGANISTYIMGYPGRIPYPSTALAGEITRFHRDNQADYDRLRQDSPILLVSPGEHLGPPPLPPRVAEFRGLYRALLETHHPFDVVLHQHLGELGDEALARYRLVILPASGALSPEAVAVVDRYVATGGALLGTLDSGTDGGETQLASLGLRAVKPAGSGRDLLSAYAEVDEQTILPLHGTVVTPVLRDGAEAQWPILPPAPFGPPEYCYGHERSGDAGLVLGRYGAGRSAVISWSIGTSYEEIGTRLIRDALIGVVDRLAPGTSLETDLPPQAELVLGRAPGRQVVHVINHVHATAHSYAEPVHLEGRQLRLPGAAGQRARALVAGTDLQTRDKGDDLVVDLPVIERFEVVVVDEERRLAGTTGTAVVAKGNS